jgi:hypothetical protein
VRAVVPVEILAGYAIVFTTRQRLMSAVIEGWMDETNGIGRLCSDALLCLSQGQALVPMPFGSDQEVL